MAEPKPADPPIAGDAAPGASPESPAEGPLSPPTRAGGSIARYVLYFVFALTALGLGYDQLARSRARDAKQQVEDAIEQQTLESPLKAADVHQMLAREPDAATSDEQFDNEIYRWRGALLTYDVIVRYQKEKEGALKDVQLGGE